MRRVDFDCGLAAGLGVAGTLYVLMKLSFDPDPPPLSRGRLVVLLIAAASYLTAAAARALFTGVKLLRRAPSWAFVSLIGSAMLVVPFYGYEMIYSDAAFGWGYALKLLLIFAVYSAPFAAGAYYSGDLMRALKKWHEGPGYRGLSILRK